MSNEKEDKVTKYGTRILLALAIPSAACLLIVLIFLTYCLLTGRAIP